MFHHYRHGEQTSIFTKSWVTNLTTKETHRSPWVKHDYEVLLRPNSTTSGSNRIKWLKGFD